MGEVFAGRYELIDPIASGGMGTVWRVLDRQDGEVKAAKMLRQTDAAMLLRFVREQSMRINHPHVVTPQSWAGVDDRVLFTMPLVRGGSVTTLLRKYGPLPPRWIGPLVDQTLQALEAVHAAGIVHRDIKPGNLLLEPTGRGRPHLRLTDFGIAVPSDEPRLTHVAMLIGTPGYMPPEQYDGADPHPSADVYALGMVVLEMLTADKPPRVPAPFDAASLRTGDPHRDAVVDLVAAATATDPAARPSAGQLRQHPALRTLLDLPPVAGDPIEIVDEFPALPQRLEGDRSTAAPPPPPPPPAGATGPTAPIGGTAVLPPPPDHGARPAPAAAPTLAAATSPEPGGARPGSALLGVVLLVLGLLGLAVSAWLVLA